MEVWRICPQRYAKRPFDGKGASEFGGRWNHPGEAVAYCSTTLSLAALEFFVNLDVTEVPDDLVAISAAFPDDLHSERWTLETLHIDWRETPIPHANRVLGSAWLQSRRTAVLFVPSAVIPEEFNVLINPAHPDFSKLQIGRPRRFQFDPRMWKAR